MTPSRELISAVFSWYQSCGCASYANGVPQRTWITTQHASVYVRMFSTRFIDGQKFTFFDVANIVVEDEFQKTGIVTDLLDWLLTNMPCDAVLIESIMNQEWYDSLVRRGWIIDPRQGNQNVYQFTEHHMHPELYS